MPANHPPRFPRDQRPLTRHGELMARAIGRLAPHHRDIVARIVQALDPVAPAPPEPGPAGAEPPDPRPPDDPG